MRIKCDYCGSIIEEQNENCPNCGAALNGINRFADGQPQTIEELKAWYIARNLPPEEVTRFFIGRNIEEPRAFGIYVDSAGDYIVYKNKADGTRAIRYQGTDEAYAVNELYQKLKSEIAERKGRSATRQYDDGTINRSNNTTSQTSGNMPALLAMCFLIPLFLIVILAVKDDTPSRGYYRYGGDTYYYQNSSWYYYDEEDDDWSIVDDSRVPEAVTSDDEGKYLTESHEGKSFEDTTWYTEDTFDDSSDWDSDWDSDYDWDSGSDWDSGGSDWNSDW